MGEVRSIDAIAGAFGRPSRVCVRALNLSLRIALGLLLRRP
jgi:hypothetical protein